MNTDDLRDALAHDVSTQPPVADGFEVGVQRRVRRRRRQAVAVAVPVVALVVVGAALVRPVAAPDATLATADATGASAPFGTVPGTTPATTVAPPSTVAVPGVTEPGAPTPSTPTTAPAPGGGDCGTVTLATAPAANPTFDTGPFTCFTMAFNADQAATLTVVATSGTTGTATNRLTTSPGHVLTVSVDGDMTVKLPAFALGGEGGVTSGEPAPSKDCGTVTVSTASLQQAPADIAPNTDKTEVQCLVSAVLQGGAARLTMVVTGDLGGSITTVVDVAADHAVTVTSHGTITMQAPAELKVPEDVLRAIPTAGAGLSGVPGLGGTGGFGGFGRK